MNRHLVPRPMRVATWVDHDRGIAEVAGEVDVYTAPELRAALSQVQAKAGQPYLVVMLGELTFMDSTGLGLLIAAHKRAAMAAGRVALVGTPRHLRRTLAVTGLDKLLPSFGSTAAAFAWFDSEASRV